MTTAWQRAGLALLLAFTLAAPTHAWYGCGWGGSSWSYSYAPTYYGWYAAYAMPAYPSITYAYSAWPCTPAVAVPCYDASYAAPTPVVLPRVISVTPYARPTPAPPSPAPAPAERKTAAMPPADGGNGAVTPPPAAPGKEPGPGPSTPKPAARAPTVTESRWQPGVIPAGGAGGVGRCKVTFWNLRRHNVALTVDGTQRDVPAGRAVTLELSRSFAWRAGTGAARTENVPTGQDAFDVVIRPE